MRSKRKNRTDILYKSTGGITDLFDNAIKQTYYISDDEYDYICENATDEELDMFVLGQNPTFSEVKQSLLVVDKYVEEFNTKQR